ncbi:MAG: tyrosine-type recombinase/integrase [Candidatus Woesearchaeota archaeon]
MKTDIHNYARQAQWALRRLKDSSVSAHNQEIIRRFVDSLVAEGISLSRVAKYTDTLRFWALWLNKDFDIVTKEDIAPIVSQIQMDPNYGIWSKKSYKMAIKRFFKWLKNSGDEFPPEVKWIKAKLRLCDKKLPSSGELLNEKDIEKLLKSINSPRDKAFVSMLWESGCRVGELCSLQINNVEIDKYGILITVQGKTGARKLRLVSSTQYLMTWLNIHPQRDDRTESLWVTMSNRQKSVPISYRAINKLLRVHCAKSGITKRCNPHMFRHSRATYLANHLTEFQMNQYFGWAQGSEMPSTYVHMSGKEVESAILVMNGIKSMDKKTEEVHLRSKTCPRCETINSYESKYCCRCAGILDIHEAMAIQAKYNEDSKRLNETDDLLDRISHHPEIIQLLAQKMQEMNTTTAKVIG